jgi:hypothetical protein
VLQTFIPAFPKYLLDLELTSFVHTLYDSDVIRGGFFHGDAGCPLELCLTWLALMDLPQDQSVSLRSLLIFDNSPQFVLG